MEKERFQQILADQAEVLAQIRESAHHLHDSVNQRYAVYHPYGYHLDMVADAVKRFGSDVCVREEDVLPVLFGAYYHDSIEDARVTYNDVKKMALQYMNDEQATMATEIVYALTNEKGRSRAERANDKYYQGIRKTPYAPFVKMADRLANITYSCGHNDALNARMRDVYRKELSHFLAAIASEKAASDVRFAVPRTMIDALQRILEQPQK